MDTNRYPAILIIGPTGSGKTTTLYAVLSSIYSPEKKFLTIEDPVEYELPGVAQIPVRPARGFTFATGLRSILRQDPDVIMVGEIRDVETAEISIRAGKSTITPVAWRVAAKKWMVENGLIKIKRAGKVLPHFSLNLCHNYRCRTVTRYCDSFL